MAYCMPRRDWGLRAHGWELGIGAKVSNTFPAWQDFSLPKGLWVIWCRYLQSCWKRQYFFPISRRCKAVVPPARKKEVKEKQQNLLAIYFFFLPPFIALDNHLFLHSLLLLAPIGLLCCPCNGHSLDWLAAVVRGEASAFCHFCHEIDQILIPLLWRKQILVKDNRPLLICTNKENCVNGTFLQHVQCLNLYTVWWVTLLLCLRGQNVSLCVALSLKPCSSVNPSGIHLFPLWIESKRRRAQTAGCDLDPLSEPQHTFFLCCGK